jgi:hypothetical protein
LVFQLQQLPLYHTGAKFERGFGVSWVLIIAVAAASAPS